MRGHARNLMTEQVTAVSPTAPLEDVARILVAGGFSGVPVVDQDNHVVGFVSETLVHAVDAAGRSLGLGKVFMGVVVVAIVGNAAEHSTAVLVAMKNKMDLSLGIAMGSSLQIALFVAPLLVISGHFMGTPLGLEFIDGGPLLTVPADVLALVLADWAARRGVLGRGVLHAAGLADKGWHGGASSWR